MEDRHRDLALQRLGIVDAIPVPAEKFSMWALEDNFIAGPLTWDKVGAILTGEVEKFE
jgi:fructuronate reductase